MSLYDQLGGGPAVTAVVVDFYQRVFADQTLAPYFQGVHVQRLIAHQAEFIAHLLGGPANTDYDLALIHRPLGISDAAFDAVLKHLQAALAKIGAGEQERRHIHELLLGLREQIVAPKEFGRVISLDDSRTWQLALQSRMPAGLLLVNTTSWSAFSQELAANDYDLALIDVHMPEIDGFEVLNRIRADPRYHRLKVALCTSRASPAMRLQAERLGADEVIGKQEDPASFTEKIQALLDRRAQVAGGE